MDRLKELRIKKRITQQKAAELTGISLRSYKTYENDETKVGTIKYHYLCETLSAYNKIDEEHGILDLEEIKEVCSKVFDKFNVNYCFLFGSYAKGNANAMSDVDLLVSADISGLKFYGMVEDLRTALHKKVDVLSVIQLKDNYELVLEILKDGIKIYG